MALGRSFCASQDPISACWLNDVQRRWPKISQNVGILLLRNVGSKLFRNNTFLVLWMFWGKPIWSQTETQTFTTPPQCFWCTHVTWPGRNPRSKSGWTWSTGPQDLFRGPHCGSMDIPIMNNEVSSMAIFYYGGYLFHWYSALTDWYRINELSIVDWYGSNGDESSVFSPKPETHQGPWGWRCLMLRFEAVSCMNDIQSENHGPRRALTIYVCVYIYILL